MWRNDDFQVSVADFAQKPSAVLTPYRGTAVVF